MSMCNTTQLFWEKQSSSKQWRNYILPGRTDEAYRDEGREQVQAFANRLRRHYTVIDYGCGAGRMTEFLIPKVSQVIGLDWSAGYIERAQKIVGNEAEFYLCKDFENVDIADVVISIMCFQHNSPANCEAMIVHIHALLVKGGLLIANFPRPEGPKYQGKSSRTFTLDELKALTKPPFRQCSSQKGNLVNYKRAIKDGEWNERFLFARK